MLRTEATGKLKINPLFIISVVILLLVPLASAQEESESTCNFLCKVTSLFSSDENIVGGATCTGFWECLLERENLAGGADDP